MTLTHNLQQIFENLLKEYGPQSWWPADSPFEVMIGAILTQNTAWSNVEKAVSGLKKAVSPTPGGILSLAPERLEEAIRPSGYFRQKADRVRGFCHYLLKVWEGDISLMEEAETTKLREELLALKGIGPETADSILLYALDRPVFVVDTYTVRLLSRLGLCDEGAKYAEVQSLFTDNLDHDAQMFNEYHALIVTHCKLVCKKREPECGNCALGQMCAFNLRSQMREIAWTIFIPFT